jgi:hypothetical protein
MAQININLFKMSKYFLISVKCELTKCYCKYITCICGLDRLNESIKSFCMTIDHYPTKSEIFDYFGREYYNIPISIISFSELPNESMYYDFKF